MDQILFLPICCILQESDMRVLGLLVLDLIPLRLRTSRLRNFHSGKLRLEAEFASSCMHGETRIFWKLCIANREVQMVKELRDCCVLPLSSIAKQLRWVKDSEARRLKKERKHLFFFFIFFFKGSDSFSWLSFALQLECCSWKIDYWRRALVIWIQGFTLIFFFFFVLTLVFLKGILKRAKLLLNFVHCWTALHLLNSCTTGLRLYLGMWSWCGELLVSEETRDNCLNPTCSEVWKRKRKEKINTEVSM